MGAALNAGGGGEAGGEGGSGLRAVLVVSRDENLEGVSRLMREVGHVLLSKPATLNSDT
jgi:hypothetical protein